MNDDQNTSLIINNNDENLSGNLTPFGRDSNLNDQSINDNDFSNNDILNEIPDAFDNQSTNAKISSSNKVINLSYKEDLSGEGTSVKAPHPKKKNLKMHSKNKSFSVIPDSTGKKMSTDNNSEKKSHDSHKLRDDNLVSSASVKEIYYDKNFQVRGIRKTKSFHREGSNNNVLNEVVEKKTSQENQFQIQSPFSKKNDQTTEMENENIQNLSHLIETDELKINSGEVTHHITSFDQDKVNAKCEEKETVINFGEKDEGETDISTKKIPLANYVQVLYDQNSERLKKRSQQMRKMKEKLNIPSETANVNKESNHLRSADIRSRVPNTTKVFKEKDENHKESILEQAINSQPKEIKNDDTELVISDLDCNLDDDTSVNKPESQTKHVKNNLSINSQSKSFIPITNNLLIKSHAKQDNVTSDYLLALNQCATNEDEDESMKGDHKAESSEKHKRFPSFKNYDVKDIIEEENSDNCTDSEFSTRKKSALYNKMRSSLSNSDKKDLMINVIPGGVGINLNQQVFSKLEGRSGSKSEVPQNFNKNKKSYNEVKEIINANHKISKSEMFNLQVDLKKILDEIEKKKKIDEENLKKKMTKKKKLILDKFFKSNSHHELPSKLEEEKFTIQNNTKKFSVYTPKNVVKSGDNLTFKKQSPIFKSKERYSNENDKEVNLAADEQAKTDELCLVNHDCSVNEIKESKNVSEFDDCFNNMITPKLTQKSSSKKEIDPSSRKRVRLDFDLGSQLKKNPSSKKDLYKHHRKKSSFFNSEDLRISKQENFKIGEDKSISKNLFNMFAINNNKSSNLIEFENDQNFFPNNDNSLVKISDSKSEISHNNIQHETITSNLTSMISFINNGTPNNIPPNQAQSCTNNNKVVPSFVDINTFDFDFKDSPLQIRIQPPDSVNYSSYDAKSGNNNLVIANPTKFEAHFENSLNKKTKSVDLLSVSNQVNINIVYNNGLVQGKEKKIDDCKAKSNSSLTPSSLAPVHFKQKNLSRDFTNIPKNIPKTTKTNASTQNLRKKTHYKTPSMNLNYQLSINTHFNQQNSNAFSNLTTNLPSNSSKMRSNSFSKNPMKTSLIASVVDEKIFKQTVKVSSKKVEGNTPKQLKKSGKTDLKQYLTFSGSKQEIVTASANVKGNYSTANNEKCNSYRINSESSISNLINSQNGSNKKQIVEAMKILNYQKSSIDHHKCAFDILNKSKANVFALLVSADTNSQKFDFKGLYEVCEEKNNLIKVYSTNFYPSSVEVSDVKDLFTFDQENNHFKKLATDFTKFSIDLIAFTIFVKNNKKI